MQGIKIKKKPYKTTKADSKQNCIKKMKMQMILLQIILSIDNKVKEEKDECENIKKEYQNKKFVLGSSFIESIQKKVMENNCLQNKDFKAWYSTKMIFYSDFKEDECIKEESLVYKNN